MKKPEKNQGFNGIRTRDLRDTGAMLYQLSYEATHWERGLNWKFTAKITYHFHIYPQFIYESFHILHVKTDRIKLTYCISDSSISFLDLFLYRDASTNVLQFSTFQKPLNKYLYIPFESFHPSIRFIHSPVY